MLAWPPEFDKDHFSKGCWVFVFCFVLGSYPMASKNTDTLSLLALPGVQTNLTDSSLIAQSLSRGPCRLLPVLKGVFRKQWCVVGK